MQTDIYQTITNQIIEALENVSLEDYQAPFGFVYIKVPNPPKKKFAGSCSENVKTNLKPRKVLEQALRIKNI